MAGIYLHIPFCKKACHYCDFHFSTSFKTKDEVLQAMMQEIAFRKGEAERLSSIYFGGGTPSVLKGSELIQLIEQINKHFQLDDSLEVTLEANPDDLNPDKLNEIKEAGINRLSIGVQSFFPEDLLWMNRSHLAEQAAACIENAHQIGFHNISMDLIFGFPLLDQEKWQANIDEAFSLPIQHLSCYSMTVEQGTALHHQIQKGTTRPMEDDQANQQYQYLMDRMADQAWDHYEISNFAKPGYRSKHNSSYWSGEPYIGIGPGAHGFTGDSRYWNPAHNVRYARAWESGVDPSEQEYLTQTDRQNEYIMTQLRQSKGIQLQDFLQRFGQDALKQLKAEAQPHLRFNHLQENQDHLTLTAKGKVVSDAVMSDLFQIEE